MRGERDGGGGAPPPPLHAWRRGEGERARGAGTRAPARPPFGPTPRPEAATAGPLASSPAASVGWGTPAPARSPPLPPTKPKPALPLPHSHLAQFLNRVHRLGRRVAAAANAAAGALAKDALEHGTGEGRSRGERGRVDARPTREEGGAGGLAGCRGRRGGGEGVSEVGMGGAARAVRSLSRPSQATQRRACGAGPGRARGPRRRGHCQLPAPKKKARHPAPARCGHALSSPALFLTSTPTRTRGEGRRVRDALGGGSREGRGALGRPLAAAAAARKKKWGE